MCGELKSQSIDDLNAVTLCYYMDLKEMCYFSFARTVTSINNLGDEWRFIRKKMFSFSKSSSFIIDTVHC